MLPDEGGGPPPRLLAGRFRLESRLGQGGFGSVYRAADELLRRPVAVKILAVPECFQESDYQLFLREARILASLEHPHIIRIYDAGRTDSGPFIVMQLANGPSLSALCRSRPLPYPTILLVLEQLLGALAFAHSRGVIHRDIKPGNVLSENEEHFYLADFGLSSSREVSSIVPSGGAAGTLNYMAPECFRGEATPSSDIFSVGALAFRMLFGRDCFEASPVRRAGIGDVPDFGAAPTPVPVPLSSLLTAMMSPEPGIRPTPAEALRLMRSLPSQGTSAPFHEERTVSLTGPLRPSPKPVLASTSQSYLDIGESLFELERLSESLVSSLSSQGPLDGAFLETFARLEEGCQRITSALGGATPPLSSTSGEDPAVARVVVEETSRSILAILDRLTATLAAHSGKLADTGLAGGVLTLQLHRLLIPKLVRPPEETAAISESGELFFEETASTGGEVRHRDDLRAGLLSADELTRIDTLLSLSERGAEALFQALGSASLPERSRILAALWNRCDILLMRMRTASRAFFESISFLTPDPEFQKKGKLLYALFRKTSLGNFWDIDAVRSTLDEMPPADRLVFARCFLLHPDPEFRAYAMSALTPGDVWDFILEESTPLTRLWELWRSFGKRPSTGFGKIFFVCTRQRLAAPRTAADAEAAYDFLKSFYLLPFFHEDSYFRMLGELQEQLGNRARPLGVNRDLDAEYAALMNAFLSAPRGRDLPVEDWTSVPLPIQRRIARKGHFLRHFVCHPVDPIALECLPHLLRLESVAPYLSIFSINSRVLLELARDRRLFQWEEARFALVANPKTPSSVVVQYISFLRRDNLKKLAESREINPFARQFALKLLSRPG